MWAAIGSPAAKVFTVLVYIPERTQAQEIRPPPTRGLALYLHCGYSRAMNTTRTASTVVNGRDLNIGDKVIHPRTGRTVVLVEELGMEGDGLRRFFVEGLRGGRDALVIGEVTAVELAA